MTLIEILLCTSLAFSTLWDIISLASVRNTFSEFTASATDILGDNAYVEAMAPIVNSITSGNLARLLNPNNLSRFLRAEANEDEIDLMQMVTGEWPELSYSVIYSSAECFCQNMYCF